MAIKRSSKISSSFSSSSMTDLIFLLLVFFVLATTLINPIHALKISLPTADSTKGSDNSSATIMVVVEDNSVCYMLNGNVKCTNVTQLGEALEKYYDESENAKKSSPVMNVSLHCDRDKTSMQNFVDVAEEIQKLNTRYHSRPENKGAKEDKYKLVIATKDR